MRLEVQHLKSHSKSNNLFLLFYLFPLQGLTDSQDNPKCKKKTTKASS